MGTILASKILADVGILINEVTPSKWPDSERLRWLNLGQRASAILKPDISVSTSTIILVAGTKQALGATATQLIKITRNMGTDGLTPGDIIPKIEMALLDRINPSWHTATASATIESYLYDVDIDPKVFYVSPPQPSSGFGYVEKIEAVTPTDIAGTSNVINIDDIYESALVAFTAGMCLSKLSAHSVEAQSTASGFFETFATMLGRKDQAESVQKQYGG